MATAIDHNDSCHENIDTWLRGVPCTVDGASSQIPSPPISGALKRKYLDDTDDIMEDDMRSLSPSEISSPRRPLDVFRNRPILKPKAPSTKASSASSRPPSPTWKLLSQLENATPPVKFYYPGNAVVQPEQVATLRKLLAKDIEQKVIPRSLEVQFVLSI